MKDRIIRDGYIHLKSMIPKEILETIREEAKQIFTYQLDRLEIPYNELQDEPNFLKSLVKLYQQDIEAFIYCGKQIQHIINLHRLSLDENLIKIIKEIGLHHPVISTRPVLFFNHPDLASKDVYNKVFTHQDWRSMQGSLDSLVIWVPLVDIGKSLGALRILPKSHDKGLLANGMEDGFGRVDLSADERERLIDVEVELGDILVFSSFLVHESGDNIEDRIRWSCHFRYNNLKENTFINRKFFHPYIYKPAPELNNIGFPSAEQMKKMYNND